MKTHRSDPDLLPEYDFTSSKRSPYAPRYKLETATAGTLADTGNTLVRTLRKTYGDDFLAEFRDDTKLRTVLKRTGAGSLDELLRRRKG